MLTFCQICFLFLSVSEYIYFKNTFAELFNYNAWPFTPITFTCYFTSTRVFSHIAHNTNSDFPSYSSNVFYNPSPHPEFTNNHSFHFVSFPFIQNSHPVFIYFCHSWHWYLGKFQDNFLIESTTVWAWLLIYDKIQIKHFDRHNIVETCGVQLPSDWLYQPSLG